MPELVRSAQRVVNAPAAVIFDLLAHPARHHEVDGSGTVTGEAFGPERLSMGDQFGVAMRRGPVRYRSSNTVVEFEEGRRIAWRTATEREGRLLVGGHVWRYELTDRGDGTTLVKESYDLTDARPRPLLAAGAASTQRDMVATLDRMAKLFA